MKKIVSERNYKLFKLMKAAKSFARIEGPENTLGATEQEGVDPRSPDSDTDTDTEIGSDTDTMMDAERPSPSMSLEGFAATYPIPENVRGWKFVSGMMDWQQITIISPSGTCAKLRPGMNIPGTNYEFTYYGRDDDRKDFAEFTPINGERFLIYYESCPNCCQEASSTEERVMGVPISKVPSIDGGAKDWTPVDELFDPVFEWHEEEEGEGDLLYIRDADADLDGFLTLEEWRRYTGEN